MAEFKGWEKIRQLGSGGQSTVFLVRSPQRATERNNALAGIDRALSGPHKAQDFVRDFALCMREDLPEELGALKVFDKVRQIGAPPEERIRREVEILRAGHDNLPKLLEADLDAKWMVTEYFPAGTLDKCPEQFKGDALAVLKAFRPLVETVSHLHSNHIIHRDIKPANVFIGMDGKLVLGDFGIAFSHDEAHARLTVTHERVGPWDYMPQWADSGERLDDVRPSFDLYMLGKLLWCMASGKPRIPREYHRRKEYDLSKLFPDDRRMHAINSVLDQCLVEQEGDCLQSAGVLLSAVDNALAHSDRGLITDADGNLSLLCLVCGKGKYVEETSGGGRIELVRMSNRHEREQPIFIRSFSCDVCTHRAFFAPGYPHEAQKRNWSRV